MGGKISYGPGGHDNRVVRASLGLSGYWQLVTPTGPAAMMKAVALTTHTQPGYRGLGVQEEGMFMVGPYVNFLLQPVPGGPSDNYATGGGGYRLFVVDSVDGSSTTHELAAPGNQVWVNHPGFWAGPTGGSSLSLWTTGFSEFYQQNIITDMTVWQVTPLWGSPSAEVSAFYNGIAAATAVTNNQRNIANGQRTSLLSFDGVTLTYSLELERMAIRNVFNGVDNYQFLDSNVPLSEGQLWPFSGTALAVSRSTLDQPSSTFVFNDIPSIPANLAAPGNWNDADYYDVPVWRMPRSATTQTVFNLPQGFVTTNTVVFGQSYGTLVGTLTEARTIYSSQALFAPHGTLLRTQTYVDFVPHGKSFVMNGVVSHYADRDLVERVESSVVVTQLHEHALYQSSLAAHTANLQQTYGFGGTLVSLFSRWVADRTTARNRARAYFLGKSDETIAALMAGSMPVAVEQLIKRVKAQMDSVYNDIPMEVVTLDYAAPVTIQARVGNVTPEIVSQTVTVSLRYTVQTETGPVTHTHDLVGTSVRTTMFLPHVSGAIDLHREAQHFTFTNFPILHPSGDALPSLASMLIPFTDFSKQIGETSGLIFGSGSDYPMYAILNGTATLDFARDPDGLRVSGGVLEYRPDEYQNSQPTGFSGTYQQPQFLRDYHNAVTQVRYVSGASPANYGKWDSVQLADGDEVTVVPLSAKMHGTTLGMYPSSEDTPFVEEHTVSGSAKFRYVYSTSSFVFMGWVPCPGGPQTVVCRNDTQRATTMVVFFNKLRWPADKTYAKQQALTLNTRVEVVNESEFMGAIVAAATGRPRPQVVVP